MIIIIRPATTTTTTTTRDPAECIIPSLVPAQRSQLLQVNTSYAECPDKHERRRIKRYRGNRWHTCVKIQDSRFKMFYLSVRSGTNKCEFFWD